MVSFWLRLCNAASRLFAALRVLHLPRGPGHRPYITPSISTTYPSASIPTLIIFLPKRTSCNKDPILWPRNLGARDRDAFETLKLTTIATNTYYSIVLLTINRFIVPPKLISELSCLTKAARLRVQWLLQNTL